LVAIGSVATLTSLISTFPQLIWISEHKPLVFGLAGAMLALAGYLQWQARNAHCPADAALAVVCAKTRKNALRIYWLSVAIFGVGIFFAFVAPFLV
jgi:sugar (pentulose or hexulose) kinase